MNRRAQVIEYLSLPLLFSPENSAFAFKLQEENPPLQNKRSVRPTRDEEPSRLAALPEALNRKTILFCPRLDFSGQLRLRPLVWNILVIRMPKLFSLIRMPELLKLFLQESFSLFGCVTNCHGSTPSRKEFVVASYLALLQRSSICQVSVFEVYGAPIAIRMDNGPEMTSERFVEWARNQGIQLRYIQPGTPNQNAFIERFNKSFRSEVLDAYLFNSLSEAQEVADHWMMDYNEKRPHESLGNVPPTQYMPRCFNRQGL